MHFSFNLYMNVVMESVPKCKDAENEKSWVYKPKTKKVMDEDE